MSWSLAKSGTREEVTAFAEVEFDRLAKNYEGTEEGADVLAVKARAVQALNEVKTSDDYPHVKLYGYGSRGTGAASFHLDVHICEAPAAPPDGVG